MEIKEKITMEKMKLEIKKNTELTQKENNLMRDSKLKEWPGKYKIRDFKKDYQNSVFFFIKENNKIAAFGTLRNLVLDYKGKKYKIFGICNIFTIKRGQGYGRILISAIIDYAKKYNRTALGFCIPKTSPFYKKAGLNIAKNLITKVIYKDPKTGELKQEDNADGLYFEGKDKLVSKLIDGDVPAHTGLFDW